MSFQAVEQGIGAIQAGNLDEGARLLKIALKNPELTGALRAVACLWLGEISSDPSEKRTYYKEALAADPSNAAVKRWRAATSSRYSAAVMPAPRSMRIRMRGS